MANPSVLTQATVSASGSPYAATSTDGLFYVDTTSGAVTINLAPATSVGKSISIKASGGACSSTAATINATGSDTIDGAGTLSIDSSYMNVTLRISAPGSWAII